MYLNHIEYLQKYMYGYTYGYTVNDYMSTLNIFYQHDTEGASPQVPCCLQLCVN